MKAIYTVTGEDEKTGREYKFQPLTDTQFTNKRKAIADAKKWLKILSCEEGGNHVVEVWHHNDTDYSVAVWRGGVAGVKTR